MRIAPIVPALALASVVALAGCASSDDDAPASSAPPTSAAPSETPTPSPATDEEVLDPYLTEIQSVDPVAYFAFYATLSDGQATTHEHDLDAGAGSYVVRFSCATVDGSGVRWTLADAAGAEVAAGTSTCAQEDEPGETAPPATVSSPVDVPGPVTIVVESTGTISGAVGLVAAG